MVVTDRLEGVPRETILVVSLVSGSHVINHLYLVLFPPILAVLAVEFDVGLAALGAAMGLQAAVNTVLQLPYGYLADNYDRTLTMALCLGLGAIGTGVIAVADTFAILLVGQVIIGAGVAGHHPGQFSLLSDATTADIRGRAYSVHGLAGNLGFAAPPVVIVGITLLPGTTWRHAFFLMAAAGAIYGVLTCYVLLRHVSTDVRLPNPAPDDDRSRATTPLERITAEVRALWAAPSVLALGVVVLLAAMAFWGVTTYVVVLLEEVYGVPSGVASLTLTGMFVVGAGLILLGGPIADRHPPGLLLAGAYALVGVTVLMLASLVLPWYVAVATALFAGSLGSLGAPARDKLMDVLSTRSDLGRNFAILTIGLMLSNTIAPPIFGLLIEWIGFRGTFIAIGSFGFLAAGATIGIMVRYRDDVSPLAGVASD